MNSFDVYLMLVSVVEGAVLLLLPHYAPRRIFFAVTVAPEFRESAEARRSLRRYHGWVLAAVAASVALARFGWPPALPFLIGFAAFLRERSVTLRHASAAPLVREATLSAADDLPPWLPVAVVPFAIPLATGWYLRTHWQEIPARFPVHWGLHGAPDRWADKTAGAVYGPLLFSSLMMLFVLALAVGIFYGSRRGPQRIVVLKLLIGVVSMTAVMFSGAGLVPLSGPPPMILFAATPLFVIALLVWSFRKARELPAESTPDAAWHLGAFYYNPDDAAVFVQKRIGLGYTFNFGNRLTWVILGGMAAMFGGMMFLLPK